MAGKKIIDLTAYGSISVSPGQKDLFEIVKNSGTYGSPSYTSGDSRKVTVEELKTILNIQSLLDFTIDDTYNSGSWGVSGAFTATVNTWYRLQDANASNSLTITLPSATESQMIILQDGSDGGTGITATCTVTNISNLSNPLKFVQSGDVLVLIYTDSAWRVYSRYNKNNLTGESGILPVTKGGTGRSTITADYIPFGNGTSQLQLTSNFQINNLATNAYKLQIGTNIGSGITTPTNIDLGGTYGTNTVGDTGNLKLKLYNVSGAMYGLGVSALKMEYQVPSSASHNWYINGVEQLKIESAGITSAIDMTAPNFIGNLSGTATQVGNSLTVDNSSLQFNAGTTYNGSAAKTISVKSSGITNAMLAGSIETTKLLSDNLNSLDGLTYLSTSFVKMTGANTFALDTSTYGKISGLSANDVAKYDGTQFVPSNITNSSTSIAIGKKATITDSASTDVILAITNTSTSANAGGYSMTLSNANSYAASYNWDTVSGGNPNTNSVFAGTNLKSRTNSSATTPDAYFGVGDYYVISSTAGSISANALFKYCALNGNANSQLNTGFVMTYGVASNNFGHFFGHKKVRIGDYGIDTTASILLDIVSSSANNWGTVGLPKIATSDAPLYSNRTGQMYYDTTTNELKYADNASWKSVLSSGYYKFDEAMPMGNCSSSYSTANTALFIRFIPKCDITITKIYYFLTSAGTDTMRVGIWSDSSNAPGTLLQQGSESTTGATTIGRRGITITSQALTGGAIYWLAVKCDSGASNFLNASGIYGTNIALSKFISGAFGSTPAPTNDSVAPYVGVGV